MEALSPWAWSFDSLLALLLLWLAWQSLTSPDLFKAIVLFIAFGLLMALAWARLEAPDVALAEAAIGAGLTGALLLAALPRLAPRVRDEKQALNAARPHAWALITVLMVTAGLSYALYSLPPEAAGLSAEVTANLAASGVSHPVTAVLLNFRGYDTLLEMVVLLTALLGVWSLAGTPQPHEHRPNPVLETLSRLLLPVLVLVAAYLLWVGAHAPGGAFQAGSVLGAAGVLLLLAGWRPPGQRWSRPLRFLLVAGPGGFVAMAIITLLIEGQLLAFPPGQAGRLILVLETLATLSIGATLAALFLGGQAPPRPPAPEEHP